MASRTTLARGSVGAALLLLIASAAHAEVPRITGITPNSGTTGATLVMISGSGFTGTTSVTFDGRAGTNLTVLNNNTIRVRTPSHQPGIVDVVVNTPEGTAKLGNGYSYGRVPLARDDAFATAFNLPLQVFSPGVLANDNSSNGGLMHAELVGGVANGTLALNADGSLLYTPAPGFTGTVTFTYRAINKPGSSNVATATITVAQPTALVPPIGLYVGSIDGHDVTLRWTSPPVGLAATDHLVEIGAGPGETLTTVSTGSATPLFRFTAPDGVLFVRVRARAGGMQSAPSNEISAFVNAPVPPSPPENVQALASGSALALSWRNTFGGGAPTSLALDVAGAAEVSLPLPLTDTFTYAAVPPGTYTFTLRALNGAGSSDASDSVTLTFPGPCSGPPAKPSNFVAYLAGSVLNVSWELGAGGPAPTGYVLDVSGSIVGSFPTTARSMSGTVGAGTYTLSVVAITPCGTSAATTPITIIIP